MRKISFCINSKIELINIVENGVEFFLKSICKVNSDILYWFMVGFHEILVNAYLHGNKKKEKLLIDIAVSFYPDKLQASVTDRGSGFNFKDIPDPTKPENILKPSGRGILFAKNACDEVFLKKEEGKFTVTIVKKLKEVENA